MKKINYSNSQSRRRVGCEDENENAVEDENKSKIIEKKNTSKRKEILTAISNTTSSNVFSHGRKKR